MDEVKNTNSDLMINLKEQVRTQISTLTTKIPSYSELTDKEKEIVDGYISKIDFNSPQTIDEFGKDETERIYKELDILIGTVRTHDISIEDMFTELMMSIDENSEPDTKQEKGGLFDSLKELPSRAFKSLKSKPKKMIANERYRRAKVLTNIDIIQEKLESIRNELRINAEKLEIMAQNSAEQYVNIQYQVIALQEMLKKLHKEKENGTQLVERTFHQIDKSIQLVGIERRVSRKIDNCIGVSVNAATKAITARLLAQHNEELASDYDQDLSSLLPELKGIVVTAEANDSLIQAVDTHNQFVSKMNEMLRTESERSKEAIKRVQEISSGSAIDIETARVLTSNVYEMVTSLKDSQEAGRPTNEAFVELLEDFRSKLVKELDKNNSYKVAESIEER